MMAGALSRSIRTCATPAVLLVAVVLLLPPLVHATTQVGDGHDAPLSFRLKRGFDVPQSKWKANPLVALRVDDAAAEIPQPPRRVRAIADVEPPSEQPHDRSPDPLRGPPLK